LDSVNRLSLVGSWAQIDADQAAPQDKGARWKSAEPKPSETTESADPSLEVVAELGRISLLGDELAGLAKGESLMLGPCPSDLIQLRVRGRLWATGTLVALGEQLGVRIVRLGG
jgi:flagellar motor switch/type III secretory pathway protein FliN